MAYEKIKNTAEVMALNSRLTAVKVEITQKITAIEGEDSKRREAELKEEVKALRLEERRIENEIYVVEQLDGIINSVRGSLRGWTLDESEAEYLRSYLCSEIERVTARPKLAIQAAIDSGKEMGKLALYFGCWKGLGHYLHDPDGAHIFHRYDLVVDLPWDEALMDGGLLKNRKIPDVPTGKVYWTCGGAKAFWYAFYWWDRSVDRRGACNSGIYVRGFGWPEAEAAFAYGCDQFPHIVNRQEYPLVLQNRSIPENA